MANINAKDALKNKANAPATKQEAKATGMRQLLKAMSEEIKAALPEQVKSERFQRVALTAFSNNDKLQNCEPVSFIAAMMQAAQLGLEPNTPLGQAYLIPYGNQVQFQVGYKGLIDLAQRTNQYKAIYAHEVRENDEFDISYGLENNITHKPMLKGDRGNVIGYYAAYKLVNGGDAFFFATKDEIEKHGQKFSKSFNNGPWKTDFDAMAKKTVLKQLLKYAPLSIELQKTVSADEQVVKGIEKETGDIAYIETSWEEVKDVPANVDPETGEIKDDDFLGKDFEPVTIDTLDL